jgi:hypothetical protein
MKGSASFIMRAENGDHMAAWIARSLHRVKEAEDGKMGKVYTTPCAYRSIIEAL